MYLPGTPGIGQGRWRCELTGAATQHSNESKLASQYNSPATTKTLSVFQVRTWEHIT